MNNDEIIDKLIVDNPFSPRKALNIYRYGSHVYGTAGPQSDVDVLMVSNIEEPYNQFSYKNFGCTVFSVEEFVKRLDEHDISMLECIFLPDNLIIKNEMDFRVSIKIDKYKLRNAVSKKASNSFVKAKKKFTVEEDKNIYVGKKSLFHSLRIPIFGKQIAEYGKITDYGAANHYWPRILDCKVEDWNYYKKIYQPILNNIMSDFRRVAPKGVMMQ